MGKKKKNKRRGRPSQLPPGDYTAVVTAVDQTPADDVKVTFGTITKAYDAFERVAREPGYEVFAAGWRAGRGVIDKGQPDSAALYLAWRDYNATR